MHALLHAPTEVRSEEPLFAMRQQQGRAVRMISPRPLPKCRFSPSHVIFLGDSVLCNRDLNSSKPPAQLLYGGIEPSLPSSVSTELYDLVTIH
jgi:hypothetical protein